jgi:hypothetical protein
VKNKHLRNTHCNGVITINNINIYENVQTGSGAHPASYPMDITGSFPGGKAAGA